MAAREGEVSQPANRSVPDLRFRMTHYQKQTERKLSLPPEVWLWLEGITGEGGSRAAKKVLLEFYFRSQDLAKLLLQEAENRGKINLKDK